MPCLVERPIICDLASRYGDVLSSAFFKVQYVTAISWDFDCFFETGADDRIVLKTCQDSFVIVDRLIHGKKGFLRFDHQPLMAGKSRLLFSSNSRELRRASVIVYSAGERIEYESI